MNIEDWKKTWGTIIPMKDSPQKKSDMIVWRDTWGKINWSASEEKIEKVIELFHNANVDFNMACPYRRNYFEYKKPLHFAAASSSAKIVAMLLNYGANPAVKDIEGNIPLHNAAWNHDFDAIEVLLQAGEKRYIDEKNKYGQTPFHAAVRSERIDTVKFFVEHGANVHIKDNDGNTPLHFAAFHGDLKTVDFLWKCAGKGSENALNDWMQTPLHSAGKNCYPEVVKFLVEHGSDVNAKDCDGATALHFAVKRRFDVLNTVKTLIELGANVNIKDSDRKTALDYVVEEEISYMRSPIFNKEKYEEIKKLEEMLQNADKVRAAYLKSNSKIIAKHNTKNGKSDSVKEYE